MPRTPGSGCATLARRMPMPPDPARARTGRIEPASSGQSDPRRAPEHGATGGDRRGGRPTPCTSGRDLFQAAGRGAAPGAAHTRPRRRALAQKTSRPSRRHAHPAAAAPNQKEVAGQASEPRAPLRPRRGSEAARRPRPRMRHHGHIPHPQHPIPDRPAGCGIAKTPGGHRRRPRPARAGCGVPESRREPKPAGQVFARPGMGRPLIDRKRRLRTKARQSEPPASGRLLRLRMRSANGMRQPSQTTPPAFESGQAAAPSPPPTDRLEPRPARKRAAAGTGACKGRDHGAPQQQERARRPKMQNPRFSTTRYRRAVRLKRPVRGPRAA